MMIFFSWNEKLSWKTTHWAQLHSFKTIHPALVCCWDYLRKKYNPDEQMNIKAWSVAFTFKQGYKKREKKKARKKRSIEEFKGTEYHVTKSTN